MVCCFDFFLVIGVVRRFCAGIYDGSLGLEDVIKLKAGSCGSFAWLTALLDLTIRSGFGVKTPMLRMAVLLVGVAWHSAVLPILFSNVAHCTFAFFLFLASEFFFW